MYICIYNKGQYIYVMWCKGFWDSRLPRLWTVRAFSDAYIRLSEAKQPWRHVTGPASATIATMFRIGWSAKCTNGVRSPKEWITPFGEIDILKMCPLSVGELVDRSTELWLWRMEASKRPGFKGSSRHGAKICAAVQ